MKRLGFLLPIIATAVLLAVLTRGLFLDTGPGESPLVGSPVPDFALDPVFDGQPGLARADLSDGQPKLMNFFASWCVPCRAEHPLLMALAEQGGTPIMGVDYLDDRGDAQKFLTDLGDPYTRTGLDARGRLGIDLGVRGVPETFVIDGEGVIVTRHLGPLTPEVMETVIKPALARAAQ